MNTVVAGDLVWVKASADYTETATVVTNGTRALPIKFKGYETTTGDGGRPTIDGESTRTHGFDFITSTARYYLVQDFIIKNTTGDACDSGANITYKRIKVQNPGSEGFDGAGFIMFESCEVLSPGFQGMSSGNRAIAAFCKIINAVTSGISFTGDGIIYSCMVQAAASIGITVGSSAGVHQGVIACTIDGENTLNEGIRLNSHTSGYPALIANNLVYDCDTGINCTDDQFEREMCLGNLLFSNTTDHSGIDTWSGERTGDPKFVDETNDDFTLGSGSDALANGIDAGEATGETRVADIGAYQAAPDYPAVGDVEKDVVYGGGTGTLVVPTAAQVEEGVGFGAGGTEFTGEFQGGGGPGLAIKGNLG
jgi:hypothetical protein